MENNPRNANTPDSGSFLAGDARPSERRSLAPIIIAVAIVLLVVAGFMLAASLRQKSLDLNSKTPDPYASQLAITGLTLSQSSNMAGSQITYVDGTITNNGNRTVDAISVQTAFHLAGSLDANGAPGAQLIPGPLSLIRSRDPYIDIEPVGANPIKPGENRPFRLIYDRISQDWDQQNPDVQVMHLHFR